jgi:predicted enzyme related to lactoylglutathione lyase
VFRLWQPLKARGYELMGEPGAPAWHQLTTRDYPAAIDFYCDVLGWRTEPATERDDFRYTTAKFDDQPLLSVMDGAKILPEGAPSQWSIFFGTEDLDKTLQCITEAGGTVLPPGEDRPFGRVATASDPTGATFSLTSLHS